LEGIQGFRAGKEPSGKNPCLIDESIAPVTTYGYGQQLFLFNLSGNLAVIHSLAAMPSSRLKGLTLGFL
jgi:hypothetical protein